MTDDALRAGKWRHEWIPLDLEAAREKFKGKVPKGWTPEGGISLHPENGGQFAVSDAVLKAQETGKTHHVFKLPSGKHGVSEHAPNDNHFSVTPAGGWSRTVGGRKIPMNDRPAKHHFYKLEGDYPANASGFTTAGRALTETHEKVGHTNQGLWHHKGMQLPAYIQHVANDLISSGHPESEAVHMAVGIVQKWARGGANVHPDTRAKAVEAIAEWERLKAQAHVTKRGGGMATATEQAVIPYNEYRRIWDLEDIHIVRTGQGDSTGRLIEAYAAVFGQRAEIHDPQGHYEEENDPAAFNDELRAINRSRGGLVSVKAIFNHGLTIHGTPSSEDSLPYGVPRHISPESRGLLTRTEVLNTPRADAILEAVRAGAITAQSYAGRVYRSDPELPGPGARYRKRGGVLPLVRRMQLGLKEYGLCPFPAFSGAEVLGVRMQHPGGLLEEDDTAEDDDFDETDGEEYAPDMDGDGAGSAPEAATSARAHPHQLLALRTAEICREHGIHPVKGYWPA